MKFFIQSEYANSSEAHAIVSACLLNDYEKQIVTKLPDQLPDDAVPVGSVEYCRKFAEIQNVELLEEIDYPEQFSSLFRRDITRTTVGEVSLGKWTKPLMTKYYPAQIYTKHSSIIHESGIPVDPATPCWMSDVVRFGAEWRLYVLDKTIIGVAQYDSGPDLTFPQTTLGVIERMVGSCDEITTYALDVGLLENTRELALVEVNAAWGTGYYPSGTLSATGYAKWLISGWAH